jgi:methyl-galactoside transport system substrate-binding protein
MKKLFSLLAVAALTLGLTACGGSADEAGSDDVTIGVVIYKYDDNFMSYVRGAIENTAEELGVDYIMNDSNNSQATQNDQIDAMIAKGVNALAVNLVDPQAAATIIAKAEAADLPVIFFNKEPDHAVLASYDKAWYVGTNSAEAGIIQGEMMVADWQANPEWDLNGDGVVQYVMLKGEPGHPDAEARTLEAVKAFTNAGIEVEMIYEDTAMWDSAQATDKLSTWLSAKGDVIELVITNNDGMALGAINAMQAAGYALPVYGVDAIPDALDNIEKGLMNGTVLNDAKNQGKASFELAYNVAQGKDVLEGTEWTLDESKAVRVPYVQVTIDNIEFGKKAYE